MTPLAQRVVTTPNPDGVLVEVTAPNGAKKAMYAMVKKVSEAGPFRWRVSNGAGGDSPLFVGAVLASAHEIDESEATL